MCVDHADDFTAQYHARPTSPMPTRWRLLPGMAAVTGQIAQALWGRSRIPRLRGVPCSCVQLTPSKNHFGLREPYGMLVLHTSISQPCQK